MEVGRGTGFDLGSPTTLTLRLGVISKSASVSGYSSPSVQKRKEKKLSLKKKLCDKNDAKVICLNRDQNEYEGIGDKNKEQ